MSTAGHTITLAISGASGALLAREMLLMLERDPRVGTIHLLASESGLQLLAHELGVNGRHQWPQKLLGYASPKIQHQQNRNIGASIASGSYPISAMIVIPCSVGTLARIAQGTATNLIERAADVCLKEARPLLLCLRETPLNKIHLRNMSLAADAGATIFPVIPTFYNHPSSVEEMAQQFVYRALAYIGLPQAGAYVWKGASALSAGSAQ